MIHMIRIGFGLETLSSQGLVGYILTMAISLNSELETAALPIPNSFLCPISQEVMEDPVRTVDAHVFERAQIAEWFRRGHRTNPLTNEQLHSLVLTPDRPLRAAIEEYMRMRPEIARREVGLCTKGSTLQLLIKFQIARFR